MGRIGGSKINGMLLGVGIAAIMLVSGLGRGGEVYAIRDIDEASIMDSIAVKLIYVDSARYDSVPSLVTPLEVKYPRLAKQAGITGTALVCLLVDSLGQVADALIAIPSGTSSLDDAALRGAFTARYHPAVHYGRHLKCWMVFEVRFLINDR